MSADTIQKEDPDYQKLIIYPNPAAGLFHVEFAQNNHSKFTLSVNNMNGQVVFQKEFVESMNEAINLSNVAKGIYFIKTSSDKKVILKKIVVD